ncbi:MAG: hypothetical protein COA78_12340 [Blastopirellula sp.]|nr:MAG: hypothetical protein COA78_12340 [Blastopirellula sp.]
MKSTIEKIDLTGLTLAPAQVWGSVRLVPLIRDNAPGDLRIAPRKYSEDQMIVSLERGLVDKGLKYSSYVPHGLIMNWNTDGRPVATFKTQIAKQEGKCFEFEGCSMRVTQRMIKREAKNRLRLLPMHVAMEGFLQLHFGGPDIAWSEYSREALALGLSPRIEESLRGQWVPGLETALRVFEIHENQVGMLVFVSDELASAFVVSHPDDYRELHRTLLEDFYGETLFYYGLYGSAPEWIEEIDGEKVNSLSDLSQAVASMRGKFSQLQSQMADKLFGRELDIKNLYNFSRFSIHHFCTNLDPASENHIGEVILRDDGTVEYMKTYRLSAAQTRRAYLLSQLAANQWNITQAAASLNQTYNELILRIKNAGFGYLLKDHVIKDAIKKAR